MRNCCLLFLLGCPAEDSESMNLLSLLRFSRWSLAGTGRVHGQFEEVIGDGEQLEISNLSVSRNRIKPEPSQWRGSCAKCRKKVEKCVGIFCGNFCVGRGQYPLFQRVWCRGCYVEHPEDEFNKSGKDSGGDW